MTASIAQAPTSAERSDPRVARTWKAAQDFEAMALGEMLKPMFATVDTAQGLLGGGDGEAAWRPMLVDEMAKDTTRHGGLGIAAPVFRQMLQMQEGARP